MNSPKSKLKRVIFIKKIKNLYYELFHNNYFILSSSVSPFFRNWGDDINEILPVLINPSGKVIQRKYSFNIKRKKDILCIGSIITWMTTPRSIIWGSGVQFPDEEILYNGKVIKPKKVLAVRGPLTRKYLLERNIDCPEIYGDPALLLPRYYTSRIEKKHKIGIIPHFKEKKSEQVNDLIQKYGFHFIDIQNFKNWKNLIDEINSCEFILSSSLHGIIIADAYGVPNSWVEFEIQNLKRFTFMDYFLSVGKPITEPVQLSQITDDSELVNLKNNWQPPQIDLNKLMSVCPFIKQPE